MCVCPLTRVQWLQSGANAIQHSKHIYIDAHEKIVNWPQFKACALKSCPTNTPIRGMARRIYCDTHAQHKTQKTASDETKHKIAQWKRCQWVRIIRAGSVDAKITKTKQKLKRASAKIREKKMIKQRAAFFLVCAINVSYDQCIFLFCLSFHLIWAINMCYSSTDNLIIFFFNYVRSNVVYYFS